MHELIGTMTVTTDQIKGSIDLKEIECGNTYVSLPIGEEYCPHCGEKLE